MCALLVIGSRKWREGAALRKRERRERMLAQAQNDAKSSFLAQSVAHIHANSAPFTGYLQIFTCYRYVLILFTCYILQFNFAASCALACDRALPGSIRCILTPPLKTAHAEPEGSTRSHRVASCCAACFWRVECGAVAEAGAA